MTGKASLTIVGDADLALLSRGYGLLGVVGHRATATGHRLIDDQRLVAHVGEREDSLLTRVSFVECTEVVRELVKLDFGLSRCRGCHSDEQRQGQHYFLHCHFLLHLVCFSFVFSGILFLLLSLSAASVPRPLVTAAHLRAGKRLY